MCWVAQNELIGIHPNPGPVQSTFDSEISPIKARHNNSKKEAFPEAKVRAPMGINNSFKSETHLAGLSGRYNFAGPGTNLDKRIKNGQILTPPINGVDRIALKHDLCYGRHRNQSRCDRDMLAELKQYHPENFRERVDKQIVESGIKLKRRYDSDVMYKDMVRIAKEIRQKPGMREGVEEDPGPPRREDKKFIKREVKKDVKKATKPYVARRFGRGRGGRRGRGRGNNQRVRTENQGMRVNNRVVNFKPKFKLQGKKDGRILLVGHEVLQTGVIFNTTDVPGMPLLNKTNNAIADYQPVLVNPTQLGLPRLAKVASIFERFVFQEFKIIFQTGLPTSTAGAVCGFFDPDIGDNFTNQQPSQIYQTAIAHKKAKQFSLWQPYMSWINPFKKTMKKGSVFDGYYTDYIKHPIEMTTQANFWLLSSIVPSANIANCGNVLVEYKCELWDPTSDPSSSAMSGVGGNFMAFRNTLTTVTANSDFFLNSNGGHVTTFEGSGSCQLFTSGDNRVNVRFFQNGYYYLILYGRGTSYTAINVTNAVNNTSTIAITGPFGNVNATNTTAMTVSRCLVTGVLGSDTFCAVNIATVSATITSNQAFCLYCGPNDLSILPTKVLKTNEEKVKSMMDSMIGLANLYGVDGETYDEVVNNMKIKNKDEKSDDFSPNLVIVEEDKTPKHVTLSKSPQRFSKF